VGLFDALLGRTKAVPANLDNLFALPSAAITLETAAGLRSSGHAGVCFKPSGTQSGADAAAEVRGLLGLDDESDGPAGVLRSVDDEYGYRWLLVDDEDLGNLVTRVHLVNTTLEEHGFGPQLLCSAFGFTPTADADQSARAAVLVYLFKRGSFYPFCPTGAEQRDNEAELRLSSLLGADLPQEQDLSRWMALWGLPVS